ncbi:MAG: PH domain-containing protein [Desulfurococcales archaeon]|nr:PH domain-containing protein [Desulfurococcales archaeon]
MARVEVRNGQLVIKLSPIEKLLSLQFKDITIPLEEIMEIETGKPPRIRYRAGGFSCCGYRYGRFIGESGVKMLLFVKGGDRAVTIKPLSKEYPVTILDVGVQGVDKLLRYAEENGIPLK